MEVDHCIAVTHFINPHLFWYKTIGAPDEQFHVLNVYEQNLVELYKNKSLYDNYLRPQIGDKVAVYFIAWNKFIRAEILQKAEFQQEEYIVWAMDYGFPLLTKKEHLRYLPSNMHNDVVHIQVGGIANIYPAEQEYDDMEGNLVMIRKDKWLQKTCNVLEKLLADANSISFVKHFESNNHNWGELVIVNHKGIAINAHDFLQKTTNAIEVNETVFRETCVKFKTTKIARWLSNDRNNKMKYNNIKHNYIEHSNQMNTIIVDENAKRKVEDWQERNERKKVEALNEILETTCDISEDNIDDITFDDSVSVANEKQQQLNYIGKAGLLTKIKQQKFASDKDIQPPAPKAFEINTMIFDFNWPTEPQSLYSTTRSSSTQVSSRLEKLAQLPAKTDLSKNQKECQHIYSQVRPLIDIGSSDTSTASSIRLRQQKLNELRKKAARAEKVKKMNETKVLKIKPTNNETTLSTISPSKISDSYPYQLLEQSLTLSTSNNTAVDNIQDNKSEISVKNLRAKRLIAMRKKFVSSTISSTTNDDSVKNTPTETHNSVKSTQSLKEDEVDKKSMLSLKNFELKPKPVTITQTKPEQFNDIFTAPMDKLKNDQSEYDSLTMIPAGYDITRLQTYKDEENHWHRKKTTRYDSVPHDQSSSIDELPSNNTTNEQSFSSSDFFPIKPPKKSLQTSSKTNIAVLETQKKISSQHQESKTHSDVKDSVQNYLSSDISTSTNSTIPSQKLCKRRQLKSPTSQLTKIDKILREHNKLKELGNTNILDLKLLNTSSSPQKSLIAVSTSSNASSNNKNVTAIDENLINNKNKHVSSHSSSSIDKISYDKIYKEACNYEASKDIKRADYLPILEGEHKVQTKFIDHLVLAHSSIQLTAIENVSEAPFLPEIHDEMREMRINKVYRIQVYSWSHVLRSNSLFVVNPTKSGKTWSYLPPLCSLLCCRLSILKESYGPAAIILVASLKHVEQVNSYCRRLMSGFKNEDPTCVPSYGMRNLTETKIKLLNGCGVLIVTPSSLLRLLQENFNEPLFDAERLQHIIIDDMDIMLSRSREDFQNAWRILYKIANKTKFKKLAPQLIVTSREWDGPMVKLIRKCSQPLLIIGDFLEAAVYGQATLSVQLKSSGEKNDAILEFLTKISKSSQSFDNRTLIMCNEDEEVEELMKFLHDCGRHCLGYYSRSTEIELTTIMEWKKKLSSQILICTDARFCQLKIQNVNNLIHYSMPTSWTRFTRRFSALANTYPNYVSQNFEKIPIATSNITNQYARSMILLDENNSLQLPRLVEFMRKHNQTVQNEISAVSKRVLIMREEQRIFNGALLCPQVLEFGECDEARCDNRHELTRFDVISKKSGLPCSGEIRLHVLKVFSATHYAVRLLHHKHPNTDKWLEVCRSSESLTFSIQLNMHYRNESNLFLHWPPHVNDLCIYQYADNFRRACILEAPDFQQKSTNVVQSNLNVTLRLIDDGEVISSVKCNEIFVCDDKFKDFPPQAIDVRLMNIVPFDNERTWDSKTTKQVKKWIMEDIKSNYVIQANIEFALANTIWVKNIVVMEKLTGINAYCQVVNLKKSLIEKNFAVLYSGERKHIRDLAEEFGFLNNELENGESDLDYQSCKNESMDLIKFSSSNDEANNSSMESAEINLELIKKTDCKAIEDTKFDVVEKSENEYVVINKDDNWDDQLDNAMEREEVYVPLKAGLAPFKNESEKNISITDDSNLPTKTETWSRLPLNEIVKVEIGDEDENGNWENIFLQIIDKSFIRKFDDLQELICKHVESIKLSTEKQKEFFDFKPFHNCIVKYNNLYLRAKIYGVFGEEQQQRLYRFFLCDYACFTNAKTEELYNDFLYETTEEIVNFTPYQAVHCTFAGIKWDRFNKRYQVTKDYLYACAVVESDENKKNVSNLHDLPIKSYKILLYECEQENDFSSATLFNKLLVDNGITVYDEETKKFLEYNIVMEEKNEFKANSSKEVENIEEIEDISKKYNKDEVLTFEQLIEFIKDDVFDCNFNNVLEDIEKIDINNPNKATESDNKNSHSKFGTNIPIAASKNPSVEEKSTIQKSIVTSTDSEQDEQGHCTSNSSSSVKSSISLSSTDASNGKMDAEYILTSHPPPLKALNRRPQTNWYETDCMIFLSIYAPDIKDYLLEVSPKTILFVADIHNEKSVLFLNLLGSINPQNVSHELKGLNVIVRLQKIVFEKWPRLLKESTKYPWLKYNFNAFDTMEMDYIMPQQHLHTMLDNELNFEQIEQQIDNYNSDEDSERELYQTYNPIQGNDDECDPFSTL